MTKYEQHLLSAAWPAMPDAEFAAFMNDIREFGQREPGIIFEGMVLDGWHRYLACEVVGEEFVAVEYQGKDPVGLVTSRNAHRRHLSASQRASAIVACTIWQPLGVNQHEGRNRVPTLGAPMTESAMAKTVGVTDRTIRQAKVAHSAGLGEAVRDGMLSAKDAAALARGKDPDTVARLALVGEKSQAKQEADQLAHDAHDGIDIAEEQEQRIRELEVQVAALTADDAKAELAKQVRIRQGIEGRLSDEMHKNGVQFKQLDGYGRWFHEMRRITGLDTQSAISKWARQVIGVAA